MLHSKDVVIAETAGSLHLLCLMDRKTIDSTFWLFSWIMHNKEKKRLPLIFFSIYSGMSKLDFQNLNRCMMLTDLIMRLPNMATPSLILSHSIQKASFMLYVLYGSWYWNCKICLHFSKCLCAGLYICIVYLRWYVAATWMIINGINITNRT